MRRINLLLKGASALGLRGAGLVVIVSFIVVVGQEIAKKGTEIEPISMPSSLADTGLTPEVAAGRLRDGLQMLVARAATGGQGPRISLRTELPDIVVPTVHFTKDNHELSSIALDEQSKIEILAAEDDKVTR